MKSRAARSVGARAIPSPVRAATSSACRPLARITAITGSSTARKIWTSYADQADWIFCLVRTDKEDKYKGITFMLFDMARRRGDDQADSC